MSTMVTSELTPAARARAIERNIDLLQAHLNVILNDPDHAPIDPISVFLDDEDPGAFEEHLALVIDYARRGYDVDLRHVVPRRPAPSR